MQTLNVKLTTSALIKFNAIQDALGTGRTEAIEQLIQLGFDYFVDDKLSLPRR